MKVSKIEKIDPDKYFDYMAQSLCKELSTKNNEVTKKEIQTGFRFFTKRNVYSEEKNIASELTCFDRGNTYILKTFYPHLTQVIIHRIEPFDDKYQITYEEKLEKVNVAEKLKFAIRARLHGYRFKMFDILDAIIEKSR